MNFSEAAHSPGGTASPQHRVPPLSHGSFSSTIPPPFAWGHGGWSPTPLTPGMLFSFDRHPLSPVWSQPGALSLVAPGLPSKAATSTPAAMSPSPSGDGPVLFHGERHEGWWEMDTGHLCSQEGPWEPNPAGGWRHLHKNPLCVRACRKSPKNRDFSLKAQSPEA